MALKKITGKDIKEAVDWLWGHKQDGGCVHQVLGTTDDGTKLCFVVGWANGRDYGDDDKKYGYFDEGYCISAKIGYQHRNNAMQTDYDWDFNMPYDLETGDVWDTSSYVPRDADWEREAADYNKEAQKIWDAYCIPNEDGTAPIDLMESKKNEGDYGAMTWTVTVEFDDNGKSVRKDYVVKAHNRDSAIDQAKLKPRHTNPDAKNIKVAYCKLGESLVKKNTCSMQKKKESVSKKNESSLSHFVVSNAETALDTVCDEILSHTNDDFVINDADAAEIVGKYAIMRELDGFGGYSGTADEFAEWVDGVLSGSPLDGSPFGSAEATEYARKIWSEED